MIKQSFTLRVLAISFILLALPLLIDSFIFFQDSYEESIDEAKFHLREVANLRAFALSAPIPVQQVLLKELITLLNLERPLAQLDAKALSEELETIVKKMPDLQIDILAPGVGGKFPIVASSNPLVVGKEFVSFDRLPEILTVGEGTFFRYVYLPEVGEYQPFIFVARTIHAEGTKEPIGLVMASSNISHLLDSVFASSGRLHTVRFALLTTDGIIFDANDPKIIGNYFDQITKKRREEIVVSQQLGEEKLAPAPMPVIVGEDPPFFDFIFHDKIHIGYRVFVPDLGISVIAYAGKETYFATMMRHFLLIYCIYGIILVVGGGLAYWLSLWISRPLRQLSSVMGEVSRNNLDVRFKKEPFGFEINLLGEIFNNTLETLLEDIQRAQDERVRKETYQRELAIGREVQQSLLPQVSPHIEGAEIAAVFRPAVVAGGTYYSFYTHTTREGEEILYLSVADAAGKGISSCLYALAGRSLIHTYATYMDSVGEILTQANRTFIQDTGETGMFMTTILAAYHTRTKRLDYQSCGHEPGFVCRADGRVEKLDHTGVAIGANETAVYGSDTVELASGDYVLFFTRGLVAVVDKEGNPFSEERLISLMQKRKWEGAQQIVEGLLAEVETFIGEAPQEEEVIILALKVQ